MRVGILGSGIVGRTLGRGFASRGHEVKLGTRDADAAKILEWLAEAGPHASAGSFAEAAEHGELVVLATSWEGTCSALSLAAPERLAGKVVVDVTNPLEFHGNNPPRLVVGLDDSGGEAVQRWLPESKVVKAFNIVTAAFMVDPDLPGGPPDMFLCGNDAEARKVVGGICFDFGWSVIDLGGIEGSRLLEPLAMLWILYGFQSGTWTHAFKLLRRPI